MTTLANPFANLAANVAANVQVVSVKELIDTLVTLKGCKFASIDAEYPMDKKMNKRNNPYYGQGLVKESTTNVMVTFDYDASLQRRSDGKEAAANNGNTWQQAIIIDGKLTPLTTHKDDVLGKDDKGNLILKNDARAYLRCEFRSSKSTIIDADGEEVSKEAVAPYLKKTSGKRTVEFHTVSLASVKRMTINGIEYRIA